MNREQAMSKLKELYQERFDITESNFNICDRYRPSFSDIYNLVRENVIDFGEFIILLDNHEKLKEKDAQYNSLKIALEKR